MVFPIDAVLPDLLASLRDRARALLIAPPGAGKTTRAAPALIGEPWCDGQVLLLVPRRLAARAAAEFMATALGEAPGATIGYATRLDSKIGKDTRIIVMTHGVFLSRIQADPELAGVSAVLFDEVHERGLDNDLALALTLDAAGALRNDLRLLAMSATLDVQRFRRLLGSAPEVVSEGKKYAEQSKGKSQEYGESRLETKSLWCKFATRKDCQQLVLDGVRRHPVSNTSVRSRGHDGQVRPDGGASPDG